MSTDDAVQNHALWVEVTYHVWRGGSGSTRMWLHQLPAWLDTRPEPTSVERIRPV